MNGLITDTEQFLPWLKQQIPLLQFMGIQDLSFDEQGLELKAALAENVNDKGTGFGGSQAALATLAGWCWVTLSLRKVGCDCDVVIRDSQQQYTAPVTSDFSVQVTAVSAEVWRGFHQRLLEVGRARIPLEIQVNSDSGVAFTMSANYTALIRVEAHD